MLEDKQTTSPWDGFKWDKSSWVVLTGNFYKDILILLKARKERRNAKR